MNHFDAYQTKSPSTFVLVAAGTPVPAAATQIVGAVVFWKTIDTTRRASGPIALDVDAARADIAEKGYHITRAGVITEVGGG